MIIDFFNTEDSIAVNSVRSLLVGRCFGVYVITFGCQQNEADSEKLLYLAEQMGYNAVSDPSEAKLIILNTCTIREHAETKALSILGRFKALKEQDPELIIGVCGCMPAVDRTFNILKNDFHYVDFTLEPNSLYKLPSTLYKIMTTGKRSFDFGNDKGDLVEGIGSSRRILHRGWISVMYGCNNFCSYCIVPYTRGRERSRRSDDVISEARLLIESGVKEITLLGQNVNSYRSDVDFPRLLNKIARIEGDYTVRFMTSHPKDVSDDLISVMAEHNPRIAPYFHLPLQSGSDRILKLMNRTYDSRTYLSVVERLRRAIPDIALSTDVIVGFPTENDSDFKDTLSVLRAAELDSAFVFGYSPREGTPASRMDGQVNREVKAERLDVALKLQDSISLKKNLAYVGRNERVLIDSISKRKKFSALNARTYSNKLVHVEADENLIGSFVNVEIVGADSYDLIGKIK